MDNKKIITFTDLVAWQKGHELVLAIYQQVKAFPANETYALTDQMKRCAVSITSNIAEGFSRQSKKEKLQFYYIAKGSLTELQNQLLIAKDVHYINSIDFLSLSDQAVSVHKLINGLIKSIKGR